MYKEPPEDSLLRSNWEKLHTKVAWKVMKTLLAPWLCHAGCYTCIAMLCALGCGGPGQVPQVQANEMNIREHDGSTQVGVCCNICSPNVVITGPVTNIIK